MNTTWCPVKVSPEIDKKYNELTWVPLFREDPEANWIYGRWINFLDTQDFDMLSRRWDEAYAIMKKMPEADKRILITDIKNASSRIASESKEYSHISSSFQSRKVADELRAMWTYDENILKNIDYIETILYAKWYPSYKILGSMDKDVWLPDIYNNFQGSLKYAFLNEEWVTMSNMDSRLINFWKRKWMSESTATRFKDDMLGSPLLTKEWSKRIWWMKSMYSFLKYSPITWLVWWSLLLANNTLLWTTLILAKRRWLEWMMSSKAVEYLLDTEAFLKSETRAWETIKNWYDQDWKNFFNKTLDNVFDIIPNTNMWNKLRMFLQWWVHNVRDMTVENTVKRLSITQALSKNWINKTNMDLFIENIKNWNISQEFMTKLRADTALNWRQFFTVWWTSSLNRNRFSKMWYLNTLQNYVINRSDDVWSWIRKAYSDFKSWQFRTYWDFADYLTEWNPEFKSILNNVLLAAKIWIYIDAMTEWHDWEDSDKRIWKYVTNMSDYISSFKSTFFYRILTAPVEWMNKYYDYTGATWKSEEILEWIPVAFLNTLSEISTQMFKEWKVLNILTDSAIALLKTWDIDFVSDVASTDIDKIVNGMWRFSLLPWFDSYWQHWIESKDDTLGRIVFEFPAFNEAIRKSQRLKDIWQIEWYINDTGRAYMNTLFNLPVLQSFYKSDRMPSWQFNEAAWKTIQSEIENNPTMKAIWNGEFPTEILNNEDITKNLYSELLSHSYYWKKLWTKWEHVVSDYWLTEMEEKVFVQNIAEWLWMSLEQLDSTLKSNRDKSYLVKTMAAAEASKPGSSKIILWYLANDALYKEKLARFGKWFTNADIDEWVENQMKRNIVEKYYPFTYISDKTSWYKLAREYLSETKPDIFWTLKNDSTLSSFVNTLAFTDMIYRWEAMNWDVDSKYIKNIFNVSAKYIKDPELRTKLVTNSLNTISNLESADQSQKQLMRLWVLSANIDHYDKIKKDPIASTLYKDDIDIFENTVRWVNDSLNKVWAHWLEGDLNDDEKRQYYWSTWKKYFPKSNSSSNNKVKDDFQNAVNKYYNPAQNWVSYNKINKPESFELAWIRIQSPKEYTLYYKIYEDAYKATSENIVKQANRKYPAEYIEWMKFTKPTYWRRFYKTVWTVIPKTRKRIVNPGAKIWLPWG